MEAQFVFVLAEAGGVEFDVAAAWDVEVALVGLISYAPSWEQVLEGGCCERF